MVEKSAWGEIADKEMSLWKPLNKSSSKKKLHFENLRNKMKEKIKFNGGN